jgi:hypothetical protein
MLFREIILVYTKNGTKAICTKCRVIECYKVGGTYTQERVGSMQTFFV